MMEAAMLLAALALDLAFGDPPTALHPVGWMGRLVSWLERLAPRGTCSPRRHGGATVSGGEATKGRLSQLLYGALMPLFGLIVFALPAWALMAVLREASPVAYFILGTLLLKSTFSIRGLLRAAGEVRRALQEGQIERARAALRSLVSRNTTALDEPLLAAATVESVAENTGDSFVAPVFYFLLLGVPGALAYRMINTFDSMVGYHGQYEYLGKASARLDDLANLVPARLAGLLLVAASALVSRTGVPAWKAMWRYHGATESPNAGWPMSAMAGALGVSLVKAGHYTLGDSSSAPSIEKVDRANKTALVAVLMMAALGAVIEVLRYAYLS